MERLECSVKNFQERERERERERRLTGFENGLTSDIFGRDARGRGQLINGANWEFARPFAIKFARTYLYPRCFKPDTRVFR